MSRELFHHGVRVLSVEGGPRPIRTVETAVIGVVGTAPEADLDVFPFNEPVAIFGSRKRAAKLGSEGSLPSAVDAILDQIGTAIVVIRVEEGGNEQELISNLIGGIDEEGRYSGLQCLLVARSKLGLEPRIILASGYTGSRPAGVSRISVPSVSKGSGYSQDSVTVELVGGNGSGAKAEALVDDGDGSIRSIQVTNPGFGYLTAPQVVIKANGSGGSSTGNGSGTGAQATAELSAIRNPVAAELDVIAHKLRAHAFIDGPNKTDEAAVAYRQDWGSRRIFIVDPHVRVWDSEADTWKVVPGSAHAAGIQARVDNEMGFWASPSNKAVRGIVGLDRDVPWSLTDPNTRANYLNRNCVATFINDKGFYLWGNYTCSIDPRFQFLSVSRTDDIIADSIARAQRHFVDLPINRTLYEDIAESVNHYIRRLSRAGAIISGECWFDPEDNPPDAIEMGRMLFSYDFSPVYPAQTILFESQITNKYLLELF